MPEILPKAAVPIRGATLAARAAASASHSHRTIPGKDVFGAKQRGGDAGSTMIEAAEVVKETPP